MCGIAGIIDFKRNLTDEEALKNINDMTNAIKHRGPNAHGVFYDEKKGVSLGHQRLKIIDISAHANQPFFNHDKSLAVIFNGEIYNYLELKSQLLKEFDFKTSSDTEVLLYMYEKYGKQCVNYLNGMFAFAVYDIKKSTVFLARDRFGQKPLFYFCKHDIFAFASELSALKILDFMPRKLNKQALHDYFSLQYILEPATVYEGVYKLPAASCMEIKLNSAKNQHRYSVQRYWKLSFAEKNQLITFDEASEHLRLLLNNSVKKRLVSDVPLGAFLSGGIDSTIISNLMTDNSNNDINLFSIGFDEKKYDEQSFAKIAVDGIKRNFKDKADRVSFYSKIVTPNDFDLVKKMVKHCGEPYSDASILPTALLSDFTAQNVTVALSGDGADELFAGYDRYLIMKLYRLLDKIPTVLRNSVVKTLKALTPSMKSERSFNGKLQRLLKIAEAPHKSRYLDIICRFDEQQKLSCYGERMQDFSHYSTLKIMDSFYSQSDAVDEVEKIMQTDINSYLKGDILTKVDIASMSASLEVRSPFLDYELAEFVASLPREFKQHNFQKKHILKEAYKGLIPKELLGRAKMGFGVPLAAWFRGKWDGVLRENLLNGQAVDSGYFTRKSIKDLIVSHQKNQKDHSYELWSILIFELFLQLEKES
ncbi:asparagine synthase (glutamine-hydrolyzing) [Lentisphaerota bacterium WC36G]|nr:asparagine synthase (glutamine-hydrolyzing) [Lentisphaerae bacterium WC36]